MIDTLSGRETMLGTRGFIFGSENTGEHLRSVIYAGEQKPRNLTGLINREITLENYQIGNVCA